MTVSSNPAGEGPLTANGVTIVFPFTFKALVAADIKVVTVDSNGVETTIATTAYVVALLVSGGTVTFNTPPASGLSVYILSNRQYSQTADIKTQGQGYRPDQNEAAVDSVVILAKQLLREIGRCLRVPETEAAEVLASAVERAGAYLGFDGAGAFTLIQPGATKSPDITWDLGGSVSADLNANISVHQTRKFESFVGFDVTAIVAPTGLPILIDWELNGVVVPAWRLTLPATQKYAELLATVTPALNDRIRPKIAQVGNVEPGQTLEIRMRGL